MPVQLPTCPGTLRPIQFYLKTAQEHDERDPVVSYWCRMWACHSALRIDKSDESKMFLTALVDWLETAKKTMPENESITNEVAAQAHIENYALKLFLYADSQDREAVFNKNVVKSFFTAGVLMDVLAVFGERSEEIVANCKYAKWKAAYIHNCLKNGETPVPGPLKDEDDELLNEDQQPGTSNNANYNPNIGFQVDNVGGFSLPDPPSTLSMGGGGGGMPSVPSSTSSINSRLPSTPGYSSPTNVIPSPISAPAPSKQSEEDGTSLKSLVAKETGKSLEPEQITKAQKYCKWAISALNYDDVTEAVTNIRKALRLLETGDES